MNGLDGEEIADQTDFTDFQPCSSCGRTFRPDILERHFKICRKVQKSSAKRKVFDSSKQRSVITGDDVLPKPPPILKRNQKPPLQRKSQKVESSENSVPAWKKKHESFVATIRAAREVTRAMQSGAPLPPPLPPDENPDYVQCPHCMRRFNEESAKRHMPFCKEHQSRAKRTPGKAAKETLDRRKQYKPPPLLRNRTNSTVSSQAVRATSSSISSSASRNAPSATSSIPRRLPSSQHQTAVTANRSSMSHGIPNSPSDGGYGSSHRLTQAGMQRLTGMRREQLPQKRIPANGIRGAMNYVRVSDDGRSSSGSDGVCTGRRHEPRPPSVPAPGSRRLDSQRMERQASAPKAAELPETGRWVSKFCYECGTRYPVTNAKYCCECGTKRI